MGVLFGLGSPQLPFAELREVLSEGVGQHRRLEQAGHLKVLGVAGQGGAVLDWGELVTWELVEFRLQQRSAQLPSPVRTEVHEQDRVVPGQGGRRLTGGTNRRGLDKLIGFAPLVSELQAGLAAGRTERSLAVDDQLEGPFSPRPALVPVHGEVAAADGGHPAGAEFVEQRVGLFQGGGRAGGRGVPPVEKGVQVDGRSTLVVDGADKLKDLPLVGMDAAGGEQAEHMQGTAGFPQPINECVEMGVALEFAALHGLIDAR